jgi:hypothetical protein
LYFQQRQNVFLLPLAKCVAYSQAVLKERTVWCGNIQTGVKKNADEGLKSQKLHNRRRKLWV